MNKVSSWKPVTDKFKSRLSDWKARSISFGGRLCLCKTVLGSLGSYYFSLFKAPAKVIKTSESIQCHFFWGGTDEKRKICWVAWNEVLNEKEKGGLGIGSLRALNLALLGSWWVRFLSYTEASWKEIVTNRYGGPERLTGDWQHFGE